MVKWTEEEKEELLRLVERAWDWQFPGYVWVAQSLNHDFKNSRSDVAVKNMYYKLISEREGDEKELIIKTFLLSGCKYEYDSYNHNAVVEYMKKDNIYQDLIYQGSVNSYDIPDELKKRFLIKKIGKLREIQFNPDGSFKKFKIGNKYYKTYYIDDFGKSVKPILDKKDDKFNLIDSGYAIELKEE